MRTLPPPEVAAEINRLSAPGATPLRQMQLALSLLQTQSQGDAARAQGLLQAVLGNDAEEARSLHSLARLLSAHYAQQRRLEEQADRQGQQLREAQRRLETLSERLEALRAIERSMPTRPAR